MDAGSLSSQQYAIYFSATFDDVGGGLIAPLVWLACNGCDRQMSIWSFSKFFESCLLIPDPFRPIPDGLVNATHLLCQVSLTVHLTLIQMQSVWNEYR